MFRSLGAGKLTTGEALEFGVVEAPDEAWADRVGRFLIHKGGDWNRHIGRALRGPLDEMQTRFYVGTVGDELITQVMVVGARGVGILGHVFTAPAWRQRGAYRQLMAAQMDDTRRLGFQIVTLGTGYNTHPYWIYHSFGFRPVAPESGLMKWVATPDAEAQYLAGAGSAARPLRWDDWAGLNLLALQPVRPDEPLPRLPSLGLKGRRSAEGPFLTFMHRCQGLDADQRRVLQSDTGAVVGWCFLAPDPRWFDDVWLLDVGALPAFQDRREALIRDLAWPDAPVVAYATPQRDRDEWLAGLGLRRAATLPGWLRADDGRRDLTLWRRESQ